MRRQLPIAVEVSIDRFRAQSQILASELETEVRPLASCLKGCHNCCYHPVLVTILEGLHIYGWLVEQHLWTTELRNRLSEHSDHTFGLSLPVWLMSRIACPLLDGGLCSIYPARPFACKITFSTGDPEDCDPHRLAGNPNMTPKREALEALGLTESSLLRQHSLPHVRLPLSTALLYGERIVKDQISIEDLQREIGKDLDAINQS